jgi:hypothetical protein
VSLEEFSGGKKIKNVGRLGNLSADEIILNAENLIKNNKTYKLLFNNCEHFIREVCNVDIKSPQVQEKLVSAGFFTLACYTRNPTIQTISIGAGLATLVTKNEEYLIKNLAIAGGVVLLVILLSK